MKVKLVINCLIVILLISAAYPISVTATNNDSKYLEYKVETVNIDENILQMLNQIDESMILEYLEELTSFGPRVTTTQACEDAARYIYSEFENLGLEVKFHNWSYGSLFGSNIEATIKGSDKSSDEIYLICGHYDSVKDSPGADDDGSGVVAALSAANVMSKNNFNHTVRFVAFSGEEQGLVGSGFYAYESTDNNENIAGVINGDMIGFAPNENDEKYVIMYENSHSEWLGDIAVDVSNQYQDIINLEVLRSGVHGGSDHKSFWDNDISAISFVEYNFNDYYHSYQDTIEKMNINYDAKVTRLMVGILAELSEPTVSNSPNTPDRPSGEINGKTGVEYTYTTSSIDLDGDQIYYMWDWGDGSTSSWMGSYNSGVEVTASHIWDETGDYQIKVKAKDTNGKESDWSDPLSVSMPKTKSLNNLKETLYKFLEEHPNIFPIIRSLIKVQ